MSDFSLLFLIGMFSPGVIRGALWYDSPAVEGILWIFATIGFVLATGWVAEKVFGSGLGPTIVMFLAVIAANVYAISGANFSSPSATGGPDDIDGHQNE
ncbi:MAG: hypothetical protein HQ536_01255 [Parcubacteria group bacterium]|nr:hypothetical protein [Parcubacteria group bacterium]